MKRGDILLQSTVRNGDWAPSVQLKWGEQGGQLTPAEARMHALAILECAEAAIHDSALVRFLIEDVGIDEEQALKTVFGLREFRGDSTREDWRGE